MSTEILNDTPDTAAAVEPRLSPTLIHNAVRNEHGKSFTLGDREFPVKDLSYDDYLEFVDLARPIIEQVTSALEIHGVDGDPQIDLNPINLDYKQLIKLAGHELPRMAWICCKQSDPKISIADVKRLGRRPMHLLEVIMLQVKHNELVKEFQDFFPRLAKVVGEMVPDVKQAVMPSTVE